MRGRGSFLGGAGWSDLAADLGAGDAGRGRLADAQAGGAAFAGPGAVPPRGLGLWSAPSNPGRRGVGRAEPQLLVWGGNGAPSPVALPVHPNSSTSSPTQPPKHKPPPSVLGPEPWNVAYPEPSVRPDDSRYGDNPNRVQRHTQFQARSPGGGRGLPRAGGPPPGDRWRWKPRPGRTPEPKPKSRRPQFHLPGHPPPPKVIPKPTLALTQPSKHPPQRKVILKPGPSF